jgi:zinc/manganese transport system ATP-binding protein
MANKTIFELRAATLAFGGQTLWQDLNLSLAAGECLAVLGPNGSGKSSLIKVLLGLQNLGQGDLKLDKSIRLGYVPQQKAFDQDLPLRGRDLVRLGLDGTQWGFNRLTPALNKQIDKVIAEVGATDYANKPIGLLSGGEQQRLRIAQAFVNDPQLLLCDEPLLSLDIASQHVVNQLIQKRCQAGAAVVFVTHEINSILPLVEKVLYLVNGKWAVGTPDEVLSSHRLSQLYGAHIDVLRVHGRVVVVNVGEPLIAEPGGAHHHINHNQAGS